MSIKDQILRRKKYIIFVSVFMVCVFMIFGCSGATEQSSLDMQKLQSDLLAADTRLQDMGTVTEQSDTAEEIFSVLADFDYVEVSRFFYTYSEAGAPEEIVVVELKEKSRVADLMSALNAHIESRKATFQQYSPEQAAMLENAVLTYKDRYVAMFISDKSGAMQEIFKKF